MSKVGIIVPFRNRWEHYNIFIPHIQEYLLSKGYNYSLIVVEQDNATSFNRGKLCNIGFLEAKKQKCTHIVFHDIDMLPIDIDYSYSNHPVHLLSEDIPFESYFGGVTLFPIDQFEQINGFSNLYWGWGFEDDDLRYRCIKNKLNLNPVKEYYIPPPEKTLIFNGFDSYATLENNINVVRDFKIEIKLRLGELIFDHEKQSDDFVVFNIEGCDFKLKYTSFKRFYLEVFDKKNQMYTLYSEVSDLRNFIISIEYIAREKIISLFVNEELIDQKTLDNPIFNYNKTENINIGSDHELNNKFKGAIDSIDIFNRHRDNITLDLIKTNVKNRLFLKKHFNYSYTPVRRTGKVLKLSHPDLGFKDGVWQNDLTRWNQLRFNNEVLLSTNEEEYEGLSNCKYTLHNKEVKGNYIHLKVGI